MFNKAAVAAIVASLVSQTLAAPLEVRADGLKVELKQVSDTEVEAVVTNTLGEEISLLNYGGLFDDHTVQKLTVTKGGQYTLLPFQMPL